MSQTENLLRQPIGEWLRRADRAITRHMDAMLAGEGITRAHWQALNMVATHAGITREGLFAALREISDASALDQIIADLMGRGWVSRPQNERLELTDAGRTAHRSLAALVDGVRHRSMHGITRDEYALVIRTLRQLVANLEPAA
jgi:DNA-binding MarR family transcriptional regulator